MEFNLKIKFEKDILTEQYKVLVTIYYYDYKELLSDTIIRKRIVGYHPLEIKKELQKLSKKDFDNVIDLIKDSATLCFKNTLISSKELFSEENIKLPTLKSDLKAELDDTII